MRNALLSATALARHSWPLARALPVRWRPLAPTEPLAIDVGEITQQFLLRFVLPLWLAAGVADWLCHRASDIEHTTGPKESLIHLAMLTEAAVPTLAALFLEVTSPVLALMIAGYVLHEATAIWGLTYASKHREVTAIEQHVHDYLIAAPLMALSFVSVLHWPQLLALFGIGGRRPDMSIRLKRHPLPWRETAILLGAMVGTGMGALPRRIVARPIRATRGGVVTRGRRETPVEQWMRESDGLPGERAALPPGTLPGPPPDPQGDEHRDPPPITPSGAGPYTRGLDLGHEGVSSSGKRQPPDAATLESRIGTASRGSAMSSATTTTDHDFIRKWAEERGGRPSKVKGTEGDDGEGILRFDFREPDDKLEQISWEEFFETFEDRNLAFLHQDETASGKTSRFFKFVRREKGK